MEAPRRKFRRSFCALSHSALHGSAVGSCFHNIISPKLALCHNRLYGILHSLRRIVVIFQQPFDEHPHFCAGRFPFLPVDCFILLQGSRQLLILIEVLDGMWFRKGIVECHLLRSQAKILALFPRSLDLLRQLAHFLYNFFIGDLPVDISIQ